MLDEGNNVLTTPAGLEETQPVISANAFSDELDAAGDVVDTFENCLSCAVVLQSRHGCGDFPRKKKSPFPHLSRLGR
jgi:hypothetical protein